MPEHGCHSARNVEERDASLQELSNLAALVPQQCTQLGAKRLLPLEQGADPLPVGRRQPRGWRGTSAVARPGLATTVYGHEGCSCRFGVHAADRITSWIRSTAAFDSACCGPPQP